MQKPPLPVYTSTLQTVYKTPNIITLLNDQLQQLPYTPQLKSHNNEHISITFKIAANSKKFNYAYKIQQKQSEVNQKQQEEMQELSKEQVIKFVIVIGRGMPYIAPRLFIKDNIVGQGFNDCRNLLYRVLKIEQWDYRIRLKDIQNAIKPFLEQLYRDLNTPTSSSPTTPQPTPTKTSQSIYTHISKLGQFELNTIFPISLLEQLRNRQPYFCFQSTPNRNIQLQMCVIDVSSTHILFFRTKEQMYFENGKLVIPNQRDVTACVLVFYAEICAISEIAIDRNNFNQLQLKFISKKINNYNYNGNTSGNFTTTSLTKKLKCRKTKQLIKSLLHTIKSHSQIIIDIKFQPNYESLNKNNQQKLLNNQVTLAEKQLMHRFNQKSIENLCDCYRRLIEYYSCCNLVYYQVFVEKMMRLYQRPDVRLILGTQDNLGSQVQNKAKDQTKEIEKTKSLQKQKQIENHGP